MVARGPVRVVDPLRTEGGFDHGSFSIGGHVVRYLNEYMTIDVRPRKGLDLPRCDRHVVAGGWETGLNRRDDRGREVALFAVDRSLLPLS